MFDDATGVLGIPGWGQTGCGCKVGVGDGDIGVVMMICVGIITIGVESAVVHAVRNVISTIVRLLKSRKGAVLF